MAVAQLLLKTLEDLDSDEFNKFKWHLTVLENCKPIAKCHLEKAVRHDTVSKMIGSYGVEPAVNVTIEILKDMNNNNAAQMLKNTYTERTAAEHKPALTASTSSSALQQPGTTISAQDRSVVIAPLFNNNSFGGSLNMNITKNT